MKQFLALLVLALALLARTAVASAETKPLVSIIIPTYNRAPFLMHALQEIVLFQTYHNIEVIVVDDSEECLSLHALNTILLSTDDRAKVHYRCVNDRRYSIGEKRNLAVREAKGTIVAFWDDDDMYPADRIHLQLAELAKRNLDIVALQFSHILEVNSTGHFLYQVATAEKFGAHYGTIMFRKSVFDGEQAVTFPTTSLAEDFAFVERAIGQGNTFGVMGMDWAYTRMGDNAYLEFTTKNGDIASGLKIVEETPSWISPSSLEFFVAARKLVAAAAKAGDKVVVNRYPSKDVAHKVGGASRKERRQATGNDPYFYLYEAETSQSFPDPYGLYGLYATVTNAPYYNYVT